MQVWSIFEDKATQGVEAQIIALPKFQIVGFAIGEEGRGREQAIIPVDLLPESSAELRERGSVLLKHAELGKTRAGNPKLCETDAKPADSFLAVLRTPYGYRGCNKHTGDFDEQGNALPFPGEIIARGYCADGAAGRMGGGEHLVAVIPMRTVFRADISGRRYGAPDEYFYYHDGTTLYAFSREDREAADLF